jgi:hypothetical protein
MQYIPLRKQDATQKETRSKLITMFSTKPGATCANTASIDTTSAHYTNHANKNTEHAWLSSLTPHNSNYKSCNTGPRSCPKNGFVLCICYCLTHSSQAALKLQLQVFYRSAKLIQVHATT